MTPTRQELKAAVETATNVCEMPHNSPSLIGASKIAILRAHLEEFDAREDFHEAALEWCGIEYGSMNVNPPTGHELELVEAYRRLVAAQEEQK